MLTLISETEQPVSYWLSDRCALLTLLHAGSQNVESVVALQNQVERAARSHFEKAISNFDTNIAVTANLWQPHTAFADFLAARLLAQTDDSPSLVDCAQELCRLTLRSAMGANDLARRRLPRLLTLMEDYGTAVIDTFVNEVSISYFIFLRILILF
jgi:hypothetical protein